MVKTDTATYKPELKPATPVEFSKVSHGLRKLDWVTVWFLGKNVNSTMSLTEAVILVGLNARAPLSPTVTL